MKAFEPSLGGLRHGVETALLVFVTLLREKGMCCVELLRAESDQDESDGLSPL